VTVLDKRGTGLSDRSLGFGSLEDRTEDIRAVLDAVESEQVILYGISESGPMAVYYTAMHPDRVRALVLFGTMANSNLGLIDRSERGRDTWAGRVLARGIDESLAELAAQWGQGTAYQHFLSHPRTWRRHSASWPGMSEAPAHRRCAARSCVGTSKWMSHPFSRRSPYPTLVMHCNRDPIVPVEAGREIADRIPGARFAEIDGDFHGSDRAAEEAIGRAGGRLVETTGDGLLATFTGPSQAVTAARAMQDAALGLGVGVRAGIHTGEIERRGDRIGGIGVHIAARVMSLARAGEVLASRTVRDLAAGSRRVAPGTWVSRLPLRGGLDVRVRDPLPAAELGRVVDERELGVTPNSIAEAMRED
jgi:pimeloyl-ACP methyl ester carboxylesterase